MMVSFFVLELSWVVLQESMTYRGGTEWEKPSGENRVLRALVMKAFGLEGREDASILVQQIRSLPAF